MSWRDRVLCGPAVGHSLLLLLAVTLLAALTECSPSGNRGQVLQGGRREQGETYAGDALEAPVDLHQLNPAKNNDGQEVAGDSGEGVSREEQEEGGTAREQHRKADVSGGTQLLEHLLQSGDSLRRGSTTSPAGRTSKQSASRDLLNALREHRHQRFQQLERLQTVPEPEGVDDTRSSSRDDGQTAGIVVNSAGGLIPPPGAVSPEALGLLPSLMVPISRGPGGDHNSILQGQRGKMDVIKGSRRAFNVTKLEYLKKEWCKTERFRQVVREEGCLRREIINRFCYGQCNSFFIPKSNKHDPNSAAFRSCAFCRPRRTFSVTVTLICPARRQRLQRKKVDVVKQCKCMAQRFDD